MVAIALKAGINFFMEHFGGITQLYAAGDWTLLWNLEIPRKAKVFHFSLEGMSKLLTYKNSITILRYSLPCHLFII